MLLDASFLFACGVPLGALPVRWSVLPINDGAT